MKVKSKLITFHKQKARETGTLEEKIAIKKFSELKQRHLNLANM